MSKLSFLTCVLLLVSPLTFAQISEGICSTWEAVLSNQTFAFREIAIPVSKAQDTFNSERDVRTRVFLKVIVREIYADPVTSRKYIDSGLFMKECVKTHRGF
jgi:hypothetical protein